MAVGSGMKKVSARVLSSRPYVDDDAYTDEEFAVCICGEVPDDKRVDLQTRYFSEPKQKWRWKTLLTSHQDCPLHGCEREPVKCHAA